MFFIKHGKLSYSITLKGDPSSTSWISFNHRKNPHNWRIIWVKKNSVILKTCSLQIHCAIFWTLFSQGKTNVLDTNCGTFPVEDRINFFPKTIWQSVRILSWSVQISLRIKLFVLTRHKQIPKFFIPTDTRSDFFCSQHNVSLTHIR